MTSWLLVGVAACAAVYLLLVLALLVAGRGDAARAAARFVPDCVALFTRLMRDPRVPLRSKLLVGALLPYLAMPFDLVPDFVPIAGQLDDAVLVVFVLRRVARRDPSLVVEHWPGQRSSLALLLRLVGAADPRTSA